MDVFFCLVLVQSKAGLVVNLKYPIQNQSINDNLIGEVLEKSLLCITSSCSGYTLILFHKSCWLKGEFLNSACPSQSSSSLECPACSPSKFNTFLFLALSTHIPMSWVPNFQYTESTHTPTKQKGWVALRPQLQQLLSPILLFFGKGITGPQLINCYKTWLSSSLFARGCLGGIASYEPQINFSWIWTMANGGCHGWKKAENGRG